MWLPIPCTELKHNDKSYEMYMPRLAHGAFVYKSQYVLDSKIGTESTQTELGSGG
jgi:hypothetical protein